MELITRTLVPRHGVAIGPDGLSRMQSALLNTTAPLSLASAPTGAGKSYVYRRAVERGERVLFVVPTRRLAQNQTEGIRADLRSVGWPERDVEKKIAAWTSDTTAPLRAEGIDVLRHRLSRLPQLRFGERGEIIFITPETLSHLLFNPVLNDGLGDVGPNALMASFDRIVFDEFHLVQPRGFGLVSFCAGLAANGPWGRETPDGPVRAKVSLLSATPVDILPVMARLGIPMAQNDLVAETIEDEGGRALHGDVTLEFVQAESPLEILREMKADVAALPDGRTALLLYDALKDLQRDRPELHAVAEELRLVSTCRFLVDNSIDSQADDTWRGRGKSLEGRRLIVATSTVEVGVTIPGLTLMVMDPGFTPLSFMQRIGRAARGALDGRIVIRIGRTVPSERPWLQRLVDYVKGSGGRIDIRKLSAFMAETARVAERFRMPETSGLNTLFAEGNTSAAQIDFFAAMPVKAAFASGLYWTILDNRLRERGLSDKAAQIRAAAPSTARIVRGWLDEVSRSGVEGARPWRRIFEAQARILRDFSPTVTVIGADGRRFEVSEAWLTKHTFILDDFPVDVTEEGTSIVRIDSEIQWNEFLREEGSWRDYRRPAALPYQNMTVPLSSRGAVEEYASAIDRLKGGLATNGRRAAERALALIRATGILPYADDRIGSSGANSGIL
jgi:CRISPR-associated endonuclease/helicase Cas3